MYIEYSKNTKEKEDEQPGKKAEEANESAIVVSMTPEQLAAECKSLDEFITQKEAKERTEKLGKLTVKEHKEEGRVPYTVYFKYFRAFGRFFFFGSFLSCCIFLGVRNISDYWLGFWAQHKWEWKSEEYRNVYIAMVMIMVGLGVTRAGLMSKGMSLVGINLNGAMMKTIFRRPISFFDSTPIGVIINRSTRELMDLDFVFNNFLQHFMSTVSQFISLVVVVCVTVPFTIPVFAFVIYMCTHYVKIITLVASDIKRITQIASAPMISNVAEIFNGILTIRAYGKMDLLKVKFKTNLERMISSEIHEKYLENWTFMRIEFSSSTIVVFTVFFAVLIKALPIVSLNNVANLSLGISWSAISGDFIAFMLMTFSEVTKGMNSVERMLEIAESTDLEPELETPKPPENWPTKAHIKITNLCMKYRPNLPLVLKRVNLDVQSRQKVGIVGRTGSGKSSFILTLMRIIDSDPPTKEGDEQEPIQIDGVGIKSIGLKYARKAITLIPQEAFVLSGTIRSNVDPYKSYSDAEVIEVLRKTKLLDSLLENSENKRTEEKGAVTIPPPKEDPDDKYLMTERNKVAELDIIKMEVDSGGSNLSQGQRQLLCIARALIKKPKVLLMDEATASIDTKTDEIIQELIKTQFKDSTILTIAHRLNTIINYDRILSLKNGLVVDYGTPLELLKDKNSYFHQLVKDNGEEFFEQMMTLASQKIDSSSKDEPRF